MKRKSCIISANCQGSYIQKLLCASPEFRQTYSTRYFVNYNQEVIPDELLSSCDLLIYQPLSDKWGHLSSSHLLSAVPANCRSIAIPFLTFPLYWPFIFDDPRNKPEEDYPFGPFPYGDRLMHDLLQETRTPDAALKRYLEPSVVAAAFDPEETLLEYVTQQRDLEQRRDQKLLDFILSNFRETKLFLTHNHPALVLCIHQVNDLLSKLGMKPLVESDVPSVDDMRNFEQPIHPAVASALKLRFESGPNTSYRIWGKPMSFTDYSRAYLNWDVEAIGKALVPPIKLPSREGENRMEANGNNNGQLLFLHLPKTAGSSLNKMLEDAFGQKEMPHFNSTLDLMQEPLRMKLPVVAGHVHYDVVRTLQPGSSIFTFLREPVERCISGFEFLRQRPDAWTWEFAQNGLGGFYRDPYIRSIYENLQTRLLGLELGIPELWEEFSSGGLTSTEYFSRIETRMNAPATREDLERAKRRLKNMAFYGFTESFDRDVTELFNQLGKPRPSIAKVNVTPGVPRKRESYSAEDLEIVASMNQYDLELYEFAQTLKANLSAPRVASI